MEVHGDEEWVRNYEGYQMEEEDMDNRVMIDLEGDITERYCQMVTTRQDCTTDHLTGMTESMPSRRRHGKIDGTGQITPPEQTVEKMTQSPERDTLS